MEQASTADLGPAVVGHPGRHDWAIMALLFLLNLAVIYPVFFPSLNQVGTWDESVYINEGRELVGGVLPKLSHNPAVAAIYALTYLPVQSSPYWLVHSCALGRFIFFALLWLSSALVATRLTGVASPLIMVALVAVSPALVGLLNNGSNAMFAAMSGFGLWQMLAFHQTRNRRHLWLASLFVGLAALSRNEGPVLFSTFVFLTVILSARRPTLWRNLTAATVPSVLVVGGFIAAYVLSTGNLNLGVQERSYVTFEQGHGMAFASTYGSLQPYVEGQNDAVRLFGTAEENNHSILRAIRRNPSAYFQRIPRLTKSAIKDLFAGYNWHFAVLAFAFTARGIVALLGAGAYSLLAVLLLWPAYVVLYVLLCYQGSHLLIPFQTIFALAALGVTATTANLDSRRERAVWTGGLVGLAGVGAAVYQQPNDLLVAPFLVLAGLWLMWLAVDQLTIAARHRVSLACLVLLGATVLVRFGVVHAEPRAPLGSAPDEQATAYMRQRLAPGAVVGAYGPGKIWTANMVHAQMVNFRTMDTPESFWEWVRREQVVAIYVDEQLRTFEPVVWNTIQTQIGQGLELGFNATGSTADQSVQVLVRTSDLLRTQADAGSSSGAPSATK